MEHIRIPIHSFIDVITNSSTEIFINTKGDTENAMHEFINKILKQSGSEKKSRDLFEIVIIKSDDGMDDILKLNSLENDKDVINVTSEIYKIFNLEEGFC
jgi:hypothetical protein